MKDFDRLYIRFRQFGGWRLAWEYARLGLLWVIVKELFRCVVHRTSFKGIYPVISQVVDPMLVERYKAYPQPSMVFETDSSSESNIEDGNRTKTLVWSCWLQGWDKAPELAKACLASLKRNLTNVEIIEIDIENYTQWVTLPEYIVEKYIKGYIPHALFSDMLRLQLLAVHGGVWIDSTVLASPQPSTSKSPYSPSWKEIIEADLFVFQYTKPGRRYSGSVSNWFIASKKGNPFIITLRDMLFAYWKDYDVALEYYICHLFFNEVAKLYPEQIKNMPYGWSVPSIALGGHLGAKFKEDKWQQFTNMVHWHKMTYRKGKELKKNKDNYYSHIIREYSKESSKSPLEGLFFELLQVAVGNRNSLSGVLSPEEWEEIYEIAKKQTMVGIAFKGVEKLPQEQLPPSRRLRQWFVKADKIRKQNERMNLECAKTCYTLQKAGFHSCIIKGQANLRSLSHDLCWYRTPGDIDVWAWSERGKVSDVISYFKERQKDADPHYHHIDCNFITETETEIHYRPSWMSAPWRNKVLQRFCDEQKAKIQKFPVALPDGRKTFFYVPSLEFDAVYQLVHIYRHLFAEGIGLRQMLDYCMVIQQLSAEQRASSYKGLCRLGMKNFIASTMFVMQEVFGMKDEYLLCAPNKKRGLFLLNEIMLAGNFGHSDERYMITREENAAEWGLMKLMRNMKFLTSYPEEVICEPWFRVYHWAWRTFKLWR